MDDPTRVTFTASVGSRAYRRTDVDAFIARVQSARKARRPVDLDRVTFPQPSFGEAGYDKTQVGAYVDLVRIHFGMPLDGSAEARRRRQERRGSFTVLDPECVPWRVYRLWFPNWKLRFLDGADPGELGLLLFAIFWPPWLLAKFLGVRWVVRVDCNGREVSDQCIRGWDASQRRLRELTHSAATGTFKA